MEPDYLFLCFSAKYSDSYSARGTGKKIMFVVNVLIGECISGNSNMTRPPTNPSTNLLYDTTVDNLTNTNIYVKYDSQEYYPEYIVEYA